MLSPGGVLRAPSAIWWAAVGGLVVLVGLTAVSDGSPADLGALRFVSEQFRADPWHLYSTVNEPRFAWPYPPLYLPLAAVIGKLAESLSLSFETLIRLPETVAALVIAWLVQWHLGWRGAPDRVRVLAFCVLVFSPVVLTTSAMHGQLDPVQIVFGVGGLIAWDRLPEGRRALVAGAILGTGAAIKTVPGLFVLALLPHAVGTRERVTLIAMTAGIPAATLVPFLAADGGAALNWLDYRGLFGQGGLSMVVQPDYVLARYGGEDFDGVTGVSQFINDHASQILLPVILLLGAWMLKKKPAPEVGICLILLCIFTVGANVFPTYVVWMLPFAVLAGWWRRIWVMQALLLGPLLVRYIPLGWPEDLGLGHGLFWDPGLVWALWIAPMTALLVVHTAWLVRELRHPKPDVDAASP
jgi:hypothetical protein